MADNNTSSGGKTGSGTTRVPADLPPEGPHAKDELQDNSKTPGAGALPDADKQAGNEADVGPD